MQRFAQGSIIARGDRVTPKASGAETVSTTHPRFETGDPGLVYVKVDVTAASGTGPTLVVVVEGSNDDSNWFELGRIGANGYALGSVATAPSNFTAVATTRGAFGAMQFVRTRSIIGGTTPSFTYSVEVQTN